MKILHIIDSLVMGGKERRLIELLKSIGALDDVECQLVLLSRTVQYNDATDLGIPIHFIERTNKMDLSVFRRLKTVCQTFRPHIIHSWESMSSIYAAPVARLLNIRFINAMITNSTPLKFLKSQWLRAKLTFPMSHLIVANSRAGLSAYRVPAHKSRCVHNGFNFSRLSRIEPTSRFRKRYRIATPKIVGMVASFDPRKDYEGFVAVANRVLSHRQDVTFIAVGDGPTLDRCRRLVSPGCLDRVRFVGKQSSIESFINLFDVAVLLTNPDVHGEGISNSIMEYMAIGKPVIATRGGGTDEIVIDHQTGFLVPPKDPDVPVEKVQYLLDNEHKARRMGKAGKAVVQASFSIEKMTREYIHIYKACLKHTRHAA